MNFIDLHTHKIEGSLQTIVYNQMVHESIKYADNQYFTAGLHPWYIQDNWNEQLHMLEKYLIQPNNIGLGEVGLDKLKGPDLAIQTMVFRAQLTLAQQYNKPVIIHNVRSVAEILNIKKQMNILQPFVFHGFNNNIKVLKQIISNRCYVSLGGAMLKENSNAERALHNLSLDQLFFETDDADFEIAQIYTKAASLLKMDLEALCNTIEENFNQIFLQNIVN